MQDDATWSAAVRTAFGQRLREVRQASQISQEELAHRSALDRSYVGQVERGERNLTLENIYKLAGGLGVPASTLLVELDRGFEFADREGTR